MRVAILSFLAAGAILLSVASTASAGTVGYWRYEDGPVGTSAGTLVATAGPNAIEVPGAPDQVFDADVPGAFIFDPVANTTVANTLSLNSPGTNLNARATAPGATLEPASFSFETFVKDDAEIDGFDVIAGKRRANAPGNAVNDPGGVRWSWMITEDSQGRVFFRMDTDVYNPDGSLASGAFNQSLQYFPTPGGGGPSVRDQEWHHVAITYDAATNEASLYIDYIQNNAKMTPSNGGTLQYDGGELTLGGRGDGGSWAGLIDESRLSDVVLSGSTDIDGFDTTNQFLLATNTNIPEPSAVVIALLGSVYGMGFVRRR
ncbi:LamG domain-containing protein [Adhaeretor mobilis]|uniref:PEP-CTERM protein-sorting domain-containing protein n=1 Tax=Adhaeretor mobilis TaxID=1930276 RepID=A0A517MZR6_9BACT|nr:LamG domain-containing protein [Adhaeretor mobilis]QDT00373.1 hypothetical protein HG15A2_37090 [Adhaeretor mobilis]